MPETYDNGRNKSSVFPSLHCFNSINKSSKLQFHFFDSSPLNDSPRPTRSAFNSIYIFLIMMPLKCCFSYQTPIGDGKRTYLFSSTVADFIIDSFYALSWFYALSTMVSWHTLWWLLSLSTDVFNWNKREFSEVFFVFASS